MNHLMIQHFIGQPFHPFTEFAQNTPGVQLKEHALLHKLKGRLWILEDSAVSLRMGQNRIHSFDSDLEKFIFHILGYVSHGQFYEYILAVAVEGGYLGSQIELSIRMNL